MERMLQKAVILNYRTMSKEISHHRACIWLFFLIVAVQKEVQSPHTG